MLRKVSVDGLKLTKNTIKFSDNILKISKTMVFEYSLKKTHMPTYLKKPIPRGPMVVRSFVFVFTRGIILEVYQYESGTPGLTSSLLTHPLIFRSRLLFKGCPSCYKLSRSFLSRDLLVVLRFYSFTNIL